MLIEEAGQDSMQKTASREDERLGDVGLREGYAAGLDDQVNELGVLLRRVVRPSAQRDISSRICK